MKIISAALAAVIVVGAAAGASAAPRVVVNGANIIAPPADSFEFQPGDTSPGYVFEDPLDRFYNPAGKIPDMRYYGPPAVDLVLARTLDRNGESIMGHIQRCQAAYPSYNSATNMYNGRNGIPTVCYR